MIGCLYFISRLRLVTTTYHSISHSTFLSITIIRLVCTTISFCRVDQFTLQMSYLTFGMLLGATTMWPIRHGRESHRVATQIAAL